MKNAKVILVLMTALLLSWSCVKDTAWPDDPSNLEHRTFYSQAMENNPIGNPTLKDMVVYTPPGYDTKKKNKYPVVYLLHGIPMTDSAFISPETWDSFVGPGNTFQDYPDFPEEGFRLWVDDLIDAGKIDPMIIVMPDARTAGYGISFYTNSVLNGNFEDLIVQDVVGFIDDQYRTFAHSKGRSAIGFSQGGYGALTFGMKHPKTFCAVASHSAPLAFEVIQGFIPILQLENPDGIPIPDAELNPMTSVVFAMSAAWSPNLNNPPTMVDFPFDLNTGTTIQSTWNRWLKYEPLTMLDEYGQNLKKLKGLYFDCGIQDEFAFWYGYETFAETLDAHGVNYHQELFNGGHFDQMFARLEISMGYCSNAMNH